MNGQPPQGDLAAAVRAAIRDVPDFPKSGILFRDITPLLADPHLFRAVTRHMGAWSEGESVTHAVGIESRGFIFAAPVAQLLSASFVPVRKPGKLPARAFREDYALEYGTDALEMHADAVKPGQRVLLVDDVLATGGTMKASADLIRGLGAEIAGVALLIELKALGGRAKLPGQRIHAVLEY